MADEITGKFIQELGQIAEARVEGTLVPVTVPDGAGGYVPGMETLEGMDRKMATVGRPFDATIIPADYVEIDEVLTFLQGGATLTSERTGAIVTYTLTQGTLDLNNLISAIGTTQATAGGVHCQLGFVPSAAVSGNWIFSPEETDFSPYFLGLQNNPNYQPDPNDPSSKSVIVAFNTGASGDITITNLPEVGDTRTFPVAQNSIAGKTLILRYNTDKTLSLFVDGIEYRTVDTAVNLGDKVQTAIGMVQLAPDAVSEIITGINESQLPPSDLKEGEKLVITAPGKFEGAAVYKGDVVKKTASGYTLTRELTDPETKPMLQSEKGQIVAQAAAAAAGVYYRSLSIDVGPGENQFPTIGAANNFLAGKNFTIERLDVNYYYPDFSDNDNRTWFFANARAVQVYFRKKLADWTTTDAVSPYGFEMGRTLQGGAGPTFDTQPFTLRYFYPNTPVEGDPVTGDKLCFSAAIAGFYNVAFMEPTRILSTSLTLYKCSKGFANEMTLEDCNVLDIVDKRDSDDANYQDYSKITMIRRDPATSAANPTTVNLSGDTGVDLTLQGVRPVSSGVFYRNGYHRGLLTVDFDGQEPLGPVVAAKDANVRLGIMATNAIPMSEGNAKLVDNNSSIMLLSFAHAQAAVWNSDSSGDYYGFPVNQVTQYGMLMAPETPSEPV